MNDTSARKRPFARLCDFCQNILDEADRLTSRRRPEEGDYYEYDCEHHHNLAAIEFSAGKGCNLCEQFFAGIRRVDKKRASEQRLRRISLYGVSVHSTFHESRGGEHIDWRLLLDIASDGEQDFLHCRLRLKLSSQQATMYDSVESSSISTQDGLPVAKQWLKECLASHKKCNALNSRYAPTRLLYLGGERVRISLGFERDKEAKYATLSHCWGSLQFETLKKHNLDAFRAQVPSDALTKTFSDAIHTARYLGLKYIWIDSLCIIQDDEEDWRNESSLMSSVYGGSTINIAAANALDGRSGCFQKRASSWRCQIQIQHATKSTIYNCIPDTTFESLEKSPLATRGWVFQERALSKRILHFTKDQVIWECEEGIFYEIAFPGRKSGPRHIKSRQIYELDRDVTWMDMVIKYSSCELTYSKDKLTALSGLARMMQENSKDEYVAGMWRKDLEGGLLWNALKPAPRLPPQAGPSWSWASIRGSVYTMSQDIALYDCRKLATVQDVNMKCASSLNPFGELESAKLTLCCDFIVRTIINYYKNETTYMDLADGLYHVNSYFDCLQISKEESVEVYILPIIYNNSSDERKNHRIEGILVEPTGEIQGQYRRVGKFSLHKEKSIVALMNYSRWPENKLDERNCVEILVGEDEFKRYVVDLV